MNKKFDFKDITLVPETISSINSRSQIDIFTTNYKLPIFVSPMDTVVDSENYETFLEEKLEVCLPRFLYGGNTFASISLDDFEKILEWYGDDELNEDINILIDIANGHMVKLYDLCKKFCEIRTNPKHRIIVGNIANPKTYEKFAELGVDFIRVGIGGGSGCLTSANTGVHYPMASLINECYQIKQMENYTTKIIADGGFRNYDDIIKALALGADYVMLGGVLNKTLESCSPTKLFKYITLSDKQSVYIWNTFPKLRKYFYKEFRGMSTKEVQRKWGKKKLTTSEGIVKYNKVEYTLESWIDNFKDYLKSAMSYTNSKTLEEFKESEFIFITENSLKRFNK